MPLCLWERITWWAPVQLILGLNSTHQLTGWQKMDTVAALNRIHEMGLPHDKNTELTELIPPKQGHHTSLSNCFTLLHSSGR